MILSLNPGSSSLKFKLFDDSVKNIIMDGDIVVDEKNISDHEAATDIVLEKVGGKIKEVTKIAVRVVHGGPKYSSPCEITDDAMQEIEKYSQFAPIHNPLALSIVSEIKKKKLDAKIFAVFDTGYFVSLPEENYIYALPEISGDIVIRRYGFHGISHQYAQKITDPDNQKKVLSVHLGAGCSITAIDHGKVVKTSMGMTPMEGLIMQTRSGDLDPGLLLYLAEKKGVAYTYNLIKKQSGLAGLSGTDGAMLSVLYGAKEKITDKSFKPEGNYDKERCRLALKIYVNKIKEYVGAYAALMNGVDVIAFTGKIGAESDAIRSKIMSNMEFLGNLKIEVVKPDEELAMAKEISNLKPQDAK